jgi:threonine/homoserine/homoserine lactone efflux protein
VSPWRPTAGSADVHVAAFLGVSVLVIVTPGQDTALTIRNVLAGGRRAGVFTAAGVALGQATWTLAAAAGIAALLRASQPAFTTVRILGAAYLVLLGGEALLCAVRGRDIDPLRPHTRSTRRSFRQGLLSNLGNAKMVVFFTSLLPQFAPPSFWPLAALGLVFCTMTFVWLAAYSVAVAKAGEVLRRSRVRRAVDGVTGAVLVGFGIRLAAERSYAA